ncbi:phosphate ABC transporter permease PstA [Paracoccus seriniphilus]|uniref:Phosphate transport system permease protein PstA n=1 Tax=Paracoccus seriniphilus TaxID=184748 RepID=A0A239PL35_9RHOB|nr:phosphate ABC transporter permease PstA [Paracoccus seriniphilus]WCR13871.1 phosphate ABC transporter permease PstA [Paracoccus seriniphilus]SNT68506.1 phosphate ABC transporter membrane protein 2, PhoT family [Paracoccus seriniphilus]
MTDQSSGSLARNHDWTSERFRKNLSRRRRNETILRGLGLGAIGLAFLMLAILLWTLISGGTQAFRQTHVAIEVPVSAELVDPENPAKGNYRRIMRDAMQGTFPEADSSELKGLSGILSNAAQFLVRDEVVADPSLIGRSVEINVPVSDPYDQLNKGNVDVDSDESHRRLSDADIAAFQELKDQGRITLPLNWGLITNADSRFPELAGLRGAIIGSAYALLVCFLISFPLGIGAAIYLEEFAPKNRFSDVIEVNINNLAAVPSVVFGLLALAVFLGWFGMPRSAPFVGGLTLALMTLPTIIIATRAALKAVPPSIREAALGIGASKQQVVFGHVLPLAMPGILTGTIIGLAQALGETAPLLLIGMNAFVTAAPATPFDASTALPTQIFIWADSPERGFVARTSAAILVLLGFLVMMNAIAIFLRSRFERRW